MKFWVWVLIALVLTGCARTVAYQSIQLEDTDNQIVQAASVGITPQPEVALKDYGTAPEWQNETWLNIESPLHLADLRGQVILLEMWTFG